jgi:hypothetical protein
MVDYVQSVIASVKPEQYADNVSEEDWAKLKADVETLFQRLTLDYQMCLTAHRRAQNPQLDMQLEEFRFRGETLWLNIRGKRYQLHERQALLRCARTAFGSSVEAIRARRGSHWRPSSTRF